MANELIKKNYKDIADAIRSKTGENGTMTAEEMPAKIEAIETGIEPEGTKSITENGEGINVREFEFVDVNVAGVQPTGTKYIKDDGEYDISEFEKVNVNVNYQYWSKYISENGEYDVTHFRSVYVETTRTITPEFNKFGSNECPFWVDSDSYVKFGNIKLDSDGEGGYKLLWQLGDNPQLTDTSWFESGEIVLPVVFGNVSIYGMGITINGAETGVTVKQFFEDLYPELANPDTEYSDSDEYGDSKWMYIYDMSRGSSGISVQIRYYPEAAS